jgi:hypothetical protein
VLVRFVDLGWRKRTRSGSGLVASTLAGAPRSPSPHRGYRKHPCAHQEHADADHSTDRNDTRGLAYPGRTGFFNPVHVKSLSTHALRSLIIARQKTVAPASDLENQIRGLAAVLENNPSIPVARCAQILAIRRELAERVNSTP